MNKGFPSQQKLSSEQNYQTISPLGSDKHGADTLPKQIFPVTNVAVAILSSVVVNTTEDSLKVVKQTIEITAHTARVGDVIRFVTGPLKSIEAPIIEIIDANIFVVPFKTGDATTSTCLLMRHVTMTLDENGASAQGPVQYVLDAVNTPTEEDTGTPVNNRALPTRTFVDIDGVQTQIMIDTGAPTNDITMPSQMYFERDGAPQKVIKDTGTPANTRAVPVELVSTAGIEATFNVTTGDLNIQTSHVGANADTIRIGDGTNLMKVNVSLEAQTRDDDLNTVAGAIADAAVVNPALSASLIANGKGQLTEILAMSAKLPASLGVKADAASLSTTESTEDRVATVARDLSIVNMSAKLPATLGSKADAASLAVTQSTEDKAILAAIKTATESSAAGSPATLGIKADAGSTSVTQSTEDRVITVARNTSLGNIDTKLPASVGSKADIASLAVTQSIEDKALQAAIKTATEATNTKLPATIGSKVDAASLAVTQSTEDKAIQAAIQAAVESASRLTVVDMIDTTPLFDASSTTINGSAGAFVEIVASTAAIVKKIQIVDDMGEYIGIYTGAAASEALVAITPLGGGEIEINIPASTRVSIRNMKTPSITIGNMAINFLG